MEGQVKGQYKYFDCRDANEKGVLGLLNKDLETLAENHAFLRRFLREMRFFITSIASSTPKRDVNIAEYEDRYCQNLYSTDEKRLYNF